MSRHPRNCPRFRPAGWPETRRRSGTCRRGARRPSARPGGRGPDRRNRTVTVAADWPTDSRRLLATAGGGGCNSTNSARGSQVASCSPVSAGPVSATASSAVPAASSSAPGIPVGGIPPSVPGTAISASAASAAGGTLSESPSSLAGADERLDRLSGVWIKRGRRLVQQQYLGLDRKGSGQAEQLLLTAGKPERRVLEPVADGIPETDLGQPVPRDFPEPVPTGQPVSTGPGDHVVHDGHRERVGPLEEHADLAPQGHQLDARVPDAPPVQQHVAGVPVVRSPCRSSG
jgi:hypothetical protein